MVKGSEIAKMYSGQRAGRRKKSAVVKGSSIRQSAIVNVMPNEKVPSLKDANPHAGPQKSV